MLLTSPFWNNEQLKDHLRQDLFSEEVVQDLGLAALELYFQRLQEWLCRPPAFSTVRVNVLKTSPSETRKKLQDSLDQQYKEKKSPAPTVEQHLTLPDALVIYPPRCPWKLPVAVKLEVIVDLLCGVAVLRGADVYAPGVLGAPAGLQEGELVSVYCDLDGRCLKGSTKPYDGQRHFIGNGVARISRRDLFTDTQPSGVAVQMRQPLFNCPSLGGVMADHIFIQNLPSIVCSRVVCPQAGGLVLDMCAAPGGKTTHLATLMNNQGSVIALDKSRHRVAQVATSCQLFGLTCVQCYVCDAVKSVTLKDPDPSCVLEDRPPGPPPYCPESFDHVLLDAPCSALGQRPQLNCKMTVHELLSYPRLQRKLFRAAVQLVKKGGILVYSTCTITVAENEDIVKWALETFPMLELEKAEPYIGGPGLQGSALKDKQRGLVQRFLLRAEDELSHVLEDFTKDTIGFFIARFRKT